MIIEAGRLARKQFKVVDAAGQQLPVKSFDTVTCEADLIVMTQKGKPALAHFPGDKLPKAFTIRAIIPGARAVEL